MKKFKNKQVRIHHMDLDQLKDLLARREMAVLHVKFLISQKENHS